MKHASHTPYRTNSPPPIEPEPMKPFRESYPRMWKAMTFCIGGGIILPALWLLFPGLYKLGMFVGNDVFNFGVSGIRQGPEGWLLGAGIIIVPVIAYFLFKKVGNEVIDWWDTRQENRKRRGQWCG